MMKNLLFAFISIFFVTALVSQDFVKEGKQWNVSEELNFGGISTAIYFIEGDSIYNSFNYKKVWFCSDTLLNACSFFGLMREQDEKVFFIASSSNQEHLLYNFNVLPGETVTVLCLAEGSDCEIELLCSQIDTVYYFEIPRKRWFFNSYESEIWIEGIGNEYGLFKNRYYECIFDMYYSLLCCYENGSLIYSNLGGNPCYINTVGINEIKSNSGVIISPNPVRRNADFKIQSSDKIDQVVIYSLTGQLIKRFKGNGNRELTIETNDLLKGIYFLDITSVNHLKSIKKLIIN